MVYENAIWEAAHLADAAVWEAIAAYRERTFSEEPAITGALVMALRNAFNADAASPKITDTNVVWSAHVMKSSSGRAAEESEYGADILFHVVFDAPQLKYSKGVLVQAKRYEPYHQMRADKHLELIDQCARMIDITPASFVFNYSRNGMRCGSALAIRGSSNRTLHEECSWTSFRFFWELFRCFVGDSRISSADPADLPVRNILQFIGSDRPRGPIRERVRGRG